MASEDGENKRFGVVIFDDDKDPAVGWAFAAGDKEPRRISGPDELSTGTIWWTNMTYEFFFRKTEVWRRSWLRHDKYLVISHKDCLSEWGYDPKNVDPSFTCQFAANVFDRVMKLAYSLSRQVNPKMTMDKVFTGTTLRHDLRRILPEPEYPRGEAAGIMQTGRAFDEFTVTGMRPMRDARHVMLRKPRLLYANEMLQTLIPCGPFEHMTRAEIFRKAPNGDRAAWIRDVGTPVMAEISVEMKNQDLAPVYGYGNSTDRDKKSQRSWVSHPEFIMLDRLGDVDVRAAYVGHEYQGLLPQLPDAVKDFLSDSYNDVSWTAGIIAETLWRASTLSEEKSKVGTLREGEDKAHTSWQGAWVKASDKVSMFLTAMKLAETGYSVVSYGLGWVRVSVHEETMKDLINDGLSLGLVPNMVDIPEGLFPKTRSVQWGGDKQSHALAHYQVTGERNLMWNLDRVPLIHPSKRKEWLAQLKKKQASGRL